MSTNYPCFSCKYQSMVTGECEANVYLQQQASYANTGEYVGCGSDYSSRLSTKGFVSNICM